METKLCECGCGQEIPRYNVFRLERQFAHGHNRTNKEQYKCDNCGKEMFVLGYNKWRKNHFCSFECTGEYKHKRNSVSKICPNCNKEFSIRKYCSKSCMSEYTKCFSKNRACAYCGSAIKEDRRIKNERVYCGKECQHKWLSENFSQENNPQWTGTKGQFRGTNWTQAKKDTIKRDGGKCRLCGGTNVICVHHITPLREFQIPEDANYPENLACVCKSCHSKTEPKRGKINQLNEKLRQENFFLYNLQ
jgi:hypothetical protein